MGQPVLWFDLIKHQILYDTTRGVNKNDSYVI